MAGRFHQLIAAAIVSAAGISPNLWALEHAPAAPSNSPSAAGSPPARVERSGDRSDMPKGDKPRKRSDDSDRGRRFFEQLPPEQRQRFRENLERWRNLPPDERDVLRKDAEVRRAKIARDIDEAIRNAGLQLDRDRRQVFTLRYVQERRKIEEQLRKEMEAKRGPMMRNMIERLKNEFASAPSPSPSPAPTASPTANP